MTGVDWLRPGIYDDIPSAVYHSDSICSRPSLSAGVIKRLIAQSPEHAWTHHPKLNPDYRSMVEQKFDVGTVAHELLLKGEQIACVIDAKDYRTNVAKAQRDKARADGQVPMLADQWERVKDMVAGVRAQLVTLEVDPPLLADGKPEQTIIWEEDGVLCRARTDWLRDDRGAIDDLKTTAGSASPVDWTRRTFWSIGCDIQAVFYQRGIEQLTGRKPAFRYVVVECEPPYAASVFDLAPSVVDLANRKIDHALQLWKRCLESDEWPGYPRHVASVEIDAWQEPDFLMRTVEPEGIAA